MQRIQEDIKSRSFHPVYLLYGEERYLVLLYRDRLKKAILDGDEINYSNFQGSAVDLKKVAQTADTLPFFGEYRLIVLEDTGLFKSSNDFADVLAAFPESTILVFAEKDVDKRNKLYKYVQKNGLAVEMALPDAAQAKRFVAQCLAGTGHTIREGTVQYFLDQTENSLFSISNEMEKLIAYTDGKEEITCADVDAVCSTKVTGQIFKMLDAVAAGEKSEVFALYHDLLVLKESPMSILFLLARHFSILLMIKTVPSGASKQEIAKKVGVPLFSVAKYQSQCKSFTKGQLKRMLQLCTETEYAFKQGKIQDQIGVETLLVQMMKHEPEN